MARLVIIADDFTGALDTGVKLASLGAKPRVVTILPEQPLMNDADVLVWDSETRHMQPEEAYRVIRTAGERFKAAPDCYVFKKTDSALRGNIGAEIQGLLDGLGEKQIAFLPAYPEIRRTTEHGIQYIDGVPVSESVFGKDLLNPVLHDDIREIIAEQSDISVHVQDVNSTELDGEGVTVFDTVSREQMDRIFTALQKQGVRIFAGCAGAGACLPGLLDLNEEKSTLPKLRLPFYVTCGSINEVTAGQLAYAEEHGFSRFRLTPEQALMPDFKNSPDADLLAEALRNDLKEGRSVMLDAMDRVPGEMISLAEQLGLTVDEARSRISHALAGMFGKMFAEPAIGTLILIGGDTLQDCMKSMNVYEMEPLMEPAPGVVLARFTSAGCSRTILTKSGGFGERTLLADLAENTENTRE